MDSQSQTSMVDEVSADANASAAACSEPTYLPAELFGRTALKWLDERLDRFTPWRDSDLDMEGVQALSEIAILYARLTSAPATVWGRLARGIEPARWHDFIVGELSRPEVAELPRKRPLHCFPYLLPYLVMRGSGYRDAYWETTLMRIDALGFPMAQEVVPFRRLDVAYFLRRSGFAPAMNLTTHFRETFLALSRSDVFVDDDSAYSITHSLLYLSDFGRQPLTGLDLQTLKRTRILLESLAVTYWRRGHWDLLGELLICMSIIGVSGRSLFGWMLTAFVAQQDFDGAFIGREGSRPTLAGAKLAGESGKVFSLCYHTTLVASILAAQLLERQ